MRPHAHLLLATALGVLLSVRATAQQDPLYSMYMWNMMTVNPAYAGSNDVLNATALVRRQWAGFEGAPETNSFIAHTPLKTKALGVGASVVDDRIGPCRTLGISGDLAYRIQMSANARLAFGLKAGSNFIRMNMSSVPGTDASDPAFQQDLRTGPQPNFGFGLYYWSQKGFVGLSAPNLLRQELASSSDFGDVRIHREEMHLFLTGGYVFTLSDAVKLKPGTLVKVVDGAPLSTDLSVQLLFMEKLWTGANYRSSGDLGLILSYQITDQLRAGYSYDLSLSPLRTQLGGSHEVMLSYDLRITERMLRSPRYF